jgi:hypothetical protein
MRDKAGETLDYTPKGRCPVCHYRTGIGRCPECGHFLTEDSLLRTQWEYLAGRWERWWLPARLCMALVLAPLFATYLFQEHRALERESPEPRRLLPLAAHLLATCAAALLCCLSSRGGIRYVVLAVRHPVFITTLICSILNVAGYLWVTHRAHGSVVFWRSSIYGASIWLLLGVLCVLWKAVAPVLPVLYGGPHAVGTAGIDGVGYLAAWGSLLCALLLSVLFILVLPAVITVRYIKRSEQRRL